MKTFNFWTIILIASGAFIFSIIMFCWTIWGQLSTDLAIDSNKFSDFGSFIGGIFGTLSFILLIFTFRESREQSFDNSFFNHLNLHDSVVRELKSKEGEIKRLNQECGSLFKDNFCDTISDETLKSQCKDYQLMPEANDYFEILYRTLHVKYNYKNDSPGQFFIDNNWRIGHFLTSFISVIEFITNSSLDNDKRSFYSRVVKARATSDELRLVFYFVTFNKNDKERIRLITLCKTLDFFGDLRDPLIKSGDMKVYLDTKTS
ncbi:MAG: putative phage abortive infection protein [Patescibacteria group bacterium]